MHIAVDWRFILRYSPRGWRASLVQALGQPRMPAGRVTGYPTQQSQQKKMLESIFALLPRDMGSAGLFMAYLFALQSLSALTVAGLWFRVWLEPGPDRIALAALASAVLLAISGARLASAVVLRSGF